MIGVAIHVTPTQDWNKNVHLAGALGCPSFVITVAKRVTKRDVVGRGKENKESVFSVVSKGT